MERERNVVVTGGGTGIGLAVSRLLHERGWSVIGAGLEKDEAFPEEARFVECDVTDKEAVASLFSPLDRLSGLSPAPGSSVSTRNGTRKSSSRSWAST